jgi:N-acetylmuramate 1-kinase
VSADRQDQRREWTQQQLGNADLRIESASADASFRSYWRVTSATPQADLAALSNRSCIVMDAPPEKENLAQWLKIQARLRSAGLNAPEVYASDIEFGFALISDLGTRTYLPELDAANVERLYASALDALFTMRGKVESADLPRYDETRLTNELELFPTWFLEKHLGFSINCDDWDIVELAFRRLINNALEQPQGFVHRDYHSRNLMITSANSPGIIDFQDAVIGPLTYDLVSLLRDCYVAWPQAQVGSWTEQYRLRLRDAGLGNADHETFTRWFDLMGLQRHLKVLGLFCRLCYRDGKPGYLRDLQRVLDYVLSVARRYPEFAGVAAITERAVGTRDVRVAASA